MIKILFTLTFLLWIHTLYGQNLFLEIDKEYFLIGSLSDYNGRTIGPDTKNKVDYYYKYEKFLALKIDTLFKNDFPDLNLVITKDSNRFELYSEILSDSINMYYVYKPSVFMTMNYDTIYCGILKADRIITDRQKISFIIGAFVRFGEKIDPKFSIRLHNSMSKAKVLFDLLKELGCTDLDYQVKEGIPTNFLISFTPTDQLKERLMEFMYLRQRLSNDWNENLRRIIGEENYDKYAR
jgi:hypothetical protein